MQPSNDDIRRQVRDIRDEHDRAMPVMREVLDRSWHDDDVTADQHAGVVLGSLPRRRFLTFGGAAILTTAFLAACGKSSSSGAPDTTTTTAKGSEKDVNILRAASSLELVAVAAYQKAIDSGLVTTAAVVTAAETFQSQHKDHAQLFQNATEGAGGTPYSKPNPALLTIVTPRLSALKTEADVVKLAYDLERLAASTYQANVGQFDNLLFNQKVMSVGGIEARHVALLAPLVGKPTTPDGAFQSISGAMSPGGL